MKPVKPVKPVNVSRNTPLRSARRRALAALTRGAVLPGLLFLPPLVAQADYATHPAAQPFIDEMVTEHGFERAQLEAWLGAAQKQQSILDAIARPAEKTKPWYEYRQIFLTERREREAHRFPARAPRHAVPGPGGDRRARGTDRRDHRRRDLLRPHRGQLRCYRCAGDAGI
jgi:hypothetical protein